MEREETSSKKSRVLSPTSRELLSIGVSRKAIATTLLLEGREEVRELINEYSDNFIDEYGQKKNITVVRGSKGDANKAELIMQLIAKELFLYGLSIKMCSVEDLLLSYRSGESELVGSALSWIFITNFFTRHSNNPSPVLSTQDTEALSSYIRNLYYRQNIGFCFYIGGEATDINKWWSDDFSQFVRKTSIGIKAGVS